MPFQSCLSRSQKQTFMKRDTLHDIDNRRVRTRFCYVNATMADADEATTAVVSAASLVDAASGKCLRPVRTISARTAGASFSLRVSVESGGGGLRTLCAS